MRKLFLPFYTLLMAACGPKFPTISPDEFEHTIAQPEVVIVDVRTPEKYAEGHIAGAVNINWKDSTFVEQATKQLDQTKTLAIYCKAGRRSHAAAAKLYRIGFTHIVELQGGIEAWKAADKPLQITSYEVDEFQTTNGKTVRFHALMHASIRIQYDGKEIEIDPCPQLGDRKVDYSQIPKADFILVTHEHHDHFHPSTIELLSAEHTKLIMNKRCVELYNGGSPMENSEQLQLTDDISIEAVPAYNTTEGRLQFHPKGRDNGYILTFDGLRIYIAGDTEDIPEMTNIKDIDIAFLPCNQPYTMTPDQLVRVAEIIHPKVLFPYHYGQTDLTSIPEALEGENIDIRIRHYE